MNSEQVSCKIDSSELVVKNRCKFCKYCPFHNEVELIYTELQDGTSKDYCPKCQELFGEKI